MTTIKNEGVIDLGSFTGAITVNGTSDNRLVDVIHYNDERREYLDEITALRNELEEMKEMLASMVNEDIEESIGTSSFVSNDHHLYGGDGSQWTIHNTGEVIITLPQFVECNTITKDTTTTEQDYDRAMSVIG